MTGGQAGGRSDVLTIQLDARESACVVCGAPLVGPLHGIPMYEGHVLPNTWSGEWAGFDACPRCFGAQVTLVEAVSVADFRDQFGITEVHRV